MCNLNDGSHGEQKWKVAVATQLMIFEKVGYYIYAREPLQLIISTIVFQVNFVIKKKKKNDRWKLQWLRPPKSLPVILKQRELFPMAHAILRTSQGQNP